MGFGDGTSYFTVAYSLDTSGLMTYSGHNTSCIAMYPPVGDPMASGDVLSLLDNVDNSTQNLWNYVRDKLAGGAGENFDDISEEQDVNWPIFVTVTNDVFTNETYINIENGDRSVNISYAGTFRVNSSLSFAMTRDTDIDNSGTVIGFDIYNVDVTRSDGMLIDHLSL